MKTKFKLQSRIRNKETETWALRQLDADYCVMHLCNTSTESPDRQSPPTMVWIPWENKGPCQALDSHHVITMMYKQAFSG